MAKTRPEFQQHLTSPPMAVLNLNHKPPLHLQAQPPFLSHPPAAIVRPPMINLPKAIPVPLLPFWMPQPILMSSKEVMAPLPTLASPTHQALPDQPLKPLSVLAVESFYWEVILPTQLLRIPVKILQLQDHIREDCLLHPHILARDFQFLRKMRMKRKTSTNPGLAFLN